MSPAKLPATYPTAPVIIGTPNLTAAVQGVTGGTPATAALPIFIPAKKPPVPPAAPKLRLFSPSKNAGSAIISPPSSSSAKTSIICASDSPPSIPNSCKIGAVPKRREL